MGTPLPASVSQTARLMADPPGFAIGWQEPVFLPVPVVGAQWSYTVDGRYYERVLALRFMITTSAVVASRNPVVVLADVAGRTTAVVPAGQNVPASTLLTIDLAVGSPGLAGGAAGRTFGFLPDLLIPPGWSWSSAVGNGDPGDQLSGVSLLVQRFPNDAAAIVAGQ